MGSVTLMLFCRVRFGELDRTLFCMTGPGGPGIFFGINCQLTGDRAGCLAGDSAPRAWILSGDDET